MPPHILRDAKINPAWSSKDQGVRLAQVLITDLKQMRVLDSGTASSEYDLDDNEEGLASDSPAVVPPISLNEADLHLTALLRLLETISVTELPTNGATPQVEVSFPDSGLRFHSLENKKQSNLFNRLVSKQPDPDRDNVERDSEI